VKKNDFGLSLRDTLDKTSCTIKHCDIDPYIFVCMRG